MVLSFAIFSDVSGSRRSSENTAALSVFRQKDDRGTPALACKIARFLPVPFERLDRARQERATFSAACSRATVCSDKAMSRFDVAHMVKRRAKAAALPYSTCCHTFRATGITTYLENGGTLEHAQTIADHESPRTTKLYDRTQEEISLDEVERIRI